MLPLPLTDAFMTRLSASGFVILSYSKLFVKIFFHAFFRFIVYEIVTKTKWYLNRLYDMMPKVGL